MPSIKKFLPRSLLGRSLMIIVTPIVLVQVVSAFIFFETHWETVSLRMARGVAGEIASLIRLMDASNDDRAIEHLLAVAEDHMQLQVSLLEGEILPNTAAPPIESILDRTMRRALREYLHRPAQVDSQSLERQVIITVQLSNGVLRVLAPTKRLFSSTTYVFVLWSAGLSLLLFGVAVIFMRNQVRPIRRLARAADAFGKARDVPEFKPEGAREVRQAATAFIRMRDRIQRQIAQRTDMLSGVSHDLRTPLTRMRLQLAMLGDSDGVKELEEDVSEMEHMLEGYLAFARGEGREAPVATELDILLEDVIGRARRKGTAVDLHVEQTLTLPLRPHAFRRALTNLVENAGRYGDHVFVRAGIRGKAMEIVVDDDGPGIPEDKREEVFKPFVRVEQSRNPGTGGVGLGLTITRDVLRAHGGDVELGQSPQGGLRAKLRIPL
ncbi:ATP-binding protein [Magnetospira sp. QH-2]|uniref:ATP-binding protein n=1 Tax=Magnetospira sp. (strain QH-2) TaxID=1288970 RepID=UPI0003E81AD4|nr:ATP-binding protein [Magnetospira sp. QH-2]CCQ72287.1 Osmolarity sensory histidine kinase [Magnetospira sp. QH-2]